MARLGCTKSPLPAVAPIDLLSALKVLNQPVVPSLVLIVADVKAKVKLSSCGKVLKSYMIVIFMYLSILLSFRDHFHC